MTIKYNPKTNRFDTVPANQDKLTPEQTKQAYARFRELVSNGMPIAEARTQANSEVMAQASAAPTTTVPKEGTRRGGRGPTPPSGKSTEGKPPTNPNSPRVAPTTTVPKTTTPSTTVPKNTTTSTAPRNAPTTTVPKSVTPTTTPRVSPTTTVPASPTTTVPAAPAAPAGTLTAADQAVLDSFGNSFGAAPSISDESGSGSGSSKSSGPTPAQKKASAKILTKAGQKAQAQYNALGERGFTDAQAAASAFYGAQTKTANTAIDNATAEYLKNIVAPTAYSNAPIAQLTPEMQGLAQNLQAYGATGQMAEQQRTQDAGFNEFIAQLLRASNTQLQQADTGYFDAMKNAGLGGQLAAKQGVATNTASMQQQSTAQADAIRRQLIQAGIEALIGGQTNAANILAQ